MVSPSFFVLLPLYIYPNPGVWKPLFNSIASTPSVNWRIIVNPNSGPGAGPYPDSNYISAIAQLNKYTNVQTLGYVHTSYGARNITSIEADIATYQGWASYNGSYPDIHVGGIFIDETPTDLAYLTYMSNLDTYTKTTMTKGNYTVFNPGAAIPSQFYAYADAINAYEAAYTVSRSTGQATALTAVPAPLRNISTIMLNTYKNSTTQLARDVAALMAENIQGLYITTKPSYNTFSADLPQFVAAVAANLQPVKMV